MNAACFGECGGKGPGVRELSELDLVSSLASGVPHDLGGRFWAGMTGIAPVKRPKLKYEYSLSLPQ